MFRICTAALAAALTVSGCATAPPGQRDGAPPWASLTSPSAALEVVLNEVCLPAILDDRPIAELAEARYLLSVPPRSSGSSQAVAAWRLGSWHDIYVMQLPNGGCSASVEAGDAQDLATMAVGMIQARAAFAPGETFSARNGEAENTAWCTPEATRPVVAGVLKKTSGRGPALVINVFRAQAARPPFCPRA